MVPEILSRETLRFLNLQIQEVSYRIHSSTALCMNEYRSTWNRYCVVLSWYWTRAHPRKWSCKNNTSGQRICLPLHNSRRKERNEERKGKEFKENKERKQEKSEKTKKGIQKGSGIQKERKVSTFKKRKKGRRWRTWDMEGHGKTWNDQKEVKND